MSSGAIETREQETLADVTGGRRQVCGSAREQRPLCVKTASDSRAALPSTLWSLLRPPQAACLFSSSPASLYLSALIASRHLLVFIVVILIALEYRSSPATYLMHAINIQATIFSGLDVNSVVVSIILLLVTIFTTYVSGRDSCLRWISTLCLMLPRFSMLRSSPRLRTCPYEKYSRMARLLPKNPFKL